MKIKICGITRSKDVEICEDNDADLIGFINIKRSSRQVDLKEIRGLVASMKDRNKAALVIEPGNLNEAINAVKQTDISTIQLHSLASEDILKLKYKMGKMPLKIIRAIGIEKIDHQKRVEIKNHAEICDFLLFDSQVKGKSGGTGKQIPIKIAIKASKIAKKHNKDIELFLAGGLSLEIIKKELKTINKYYDYIDVNSGIEDHPGVKNPNKILELMKFVKKA